MNFTPPPSRTRIWVSLALIVYSLPALVGLFTFDIADIPSFNSDASTSVTRNMAGIFGAVNAWSLLSLTGFAAFLIPVWGFTTAWLMLTGRKPGQWRMFGFVFWSVVLLLSAAGLLQFTGGFFAPLLEGGGRFGIPYIGGGAGWFVTDAMTHWIGAGGAVGVLIAALFVSLVMMVGPGEIGEYIFTLRARGEEAERQVEEAVEEAISTGMNPVEARRLAKEAEKLRKAEEKAAAKLAKEEEKERRRAAKEAEKAEELAKHETERILRKMDAEAVVEKSAKAVAKAAVSAEQKEPAKAEISAPTGPTFAATEVDFTLPKTQILAPVPKVATDEGAEGEIAENIGTICRTLGEFGIEVEVSDVVRGPVITCYEVKTPPGVKVDRISSYSNDLQMKLKAKSIRILSPIPGKSVMGIEIPNKVRRSVSLREVVERQEWKNAVQNQALPMLLGMDVSGAPVIADLAKMPHILVAGATGSGKSVCLNSILAGFLLSRTPDDLRLLMVDPKMVEFTPYSELPHLVVPIITAPKKVAAALQWSIVEMKRRLAIFKEVGVRNIAAFNSRDRAKQTTFFGDDDDSPIVIPDKLPHIVIVIDEMADLMMMAQKEVEPRVASLAQLSRAVGIHMILATQRPSVNVITGLIKANFPARIAFRVSQRVDSQTILDSKGAESLIGMGDMLFNNPSGMLIRAQGTWISDAEVGDLVGWYKKQSPPVYVEEIKAKLDRMVIKPEKDEYDEDGAGGASSADDDADADEETKTLGAALDIIVKTGRASTSGLQRQLGFGYTRAARIMDELEKRGCIGPPVGSGSNREILRTTLGEPEDM